MKFKIGDKVFCVDGPLDSSIIGEVILINPTFTRLLVKFPNEDVWGKEEWFDYENS